LNGGYILSKILMFYIRLLMRL